MKVSGASASADGKAAEEFLETLDKLRVQDNYVLVLTWPPVDESPFRDLFPELGGFVCVEYNLTR